MSKAKQSKIKAIKNRKSHNNRCDLRKWDVDGNKRRCKNCTEFFLPEELTKGQLKCKPCWAEEMKNYRKGTLNEYREKVNKKNELIESQYFINKVKKCNTCFEIKDFSQFYNEKNTWDGLQNKCKQCQSDYNSSYDPYSKLYNKKKHKEYYDYQRKNNIQFKLTLSLRSRFKMVLKRYLLKKEESSLNLIGIPIKDFVSYIENKFVTGYMNWENHGDVWELDHIKPISKFDLTDETQVKECFHYTNFQPLFKVTTIIDGVEYLGNRNKSNK